MSEALARRQGWYYVVTGLWPIVSPRSFQRVTGPKRDMWLVETVGLLATSIGATLLVGSRRGVRPETRLLGAASAASFGAIDLIYGGSGRIRRIYLGDALVQAAFLADWLRRP